MDALRNQKLVIGDGSLAEEIAGTGKLVEVKAGTSITTQGTKDTDVFFILAGAFDVFVHGRKAARRFPNDHDGEMAAIQLPRSDPPLSPRRKPLLYARYPELSLMNLDGSTQEFGGSSQRNWRDVSNSANAHVLATHSKIRNFIISSAEALAIARTIQNALDHDFTVTLWTDGVFRASWYPVESLEKQLDQSDLPLP